MTAFRAFAIVSIFAVVSAAWFTLGGSVRTRTELLDESLSAEMESLWGPKVLIQCSPYWAADRQSDPAGGPSAPLRASVPPLSSQIQAQITHNHRYKGLLWYNTFKVAFVAKYTVEPEGGGPAAASGSFVIPLPRGVAAYDDLRVELDGRPQTIRPADIAAREIVLPMARGEAHAVAVNYMTTGQDVWLYAPGAAIPNVVDRNGSGGLTRKYEVSSIGSPLVALKDFSLTVAADFADIDYPTGTRSPLTPADIHGGAATATWQYANALTNQAMGVVVPQQTNAGPIAARMSFFAPVGLFFFFTVLFTIAVLRKIALHPMHYLFIAAGFFAFHILLAYLADTVNVHAAFWICALVSALLVVTYMRLVVGGQLALLYVGLAQVIYLIGFSYAFFWVGKTGLTVTVGAVATLFVLMQATGRLNWHDVFRRPDRPTPIPAAYLWPHGEPIPDAGPGPTPEPAPPSGPTPQPVQPPPLPKD